MRAAAPTPPISAALSLSCRRLAAAGNEALAILRVLRTRIATMAQYQISRAVQE
jgi:hypothetical protein